MATETKDKKPTAGNLRALFNNQSWLKTLRKRMGLGDTLGPLTEECGGTGAESIASVFSRLTFDVESHISFASLGSSVSPSYNMSVMPYIRKDGTYISFVVHNNNVRTNYVSVANGSTLKSGKAFAASKTFSINSSKDNAPRAEAWHVVENDDGSVKLYIVLWSTTIDQRNLVTVSITSEGAMSVSVGANITTLGASKRSAVGYAFDDSNDVIFAFKEISSDIKQCLTRINSNGSVSIESLSGDIVSYGSTLVFASDSSHILVNYGNNACYLIDIKAKTSKSINTSAISNTLSSSYSIATLDDVTKLIAVSSTADLTIGQIDKGSGDVSIENIYPMLLSAHISTTYGIRLSDENHAFTASASNSDDNRVAYWNTNLETYVTRYAKKRTSLNFSGSHVMRGDYIYALSTSGSISIYRL